MIIDIILDRRGFENDGYDGYYNRSKFKDLYDYAMFFEFTELARAIDGGEEKDVKRELCKYIDEQNYNPNIKEYINSVDWVVEE